MGNTQNTQFREEPILEHSQLGSASEFYWACRNGDEERVKQLLNCIPYDSLNRLELNGSTALHAASYYGHAEIVRLLLHQRSCRRERLNRYGLTAYQEAKNQEIRQLFHRPGNKNRFSDGKGQSVGDILSVSIGEGENEFKEDKWVQGISESEEIEKYRLLVAELKNTLNPPAFVTMVQRIFGSAGEKDDKMLNEIIDRHVTRENKDYEKCKALVAQAFREARPEPLLHLYTLDTPLYGALGDWATPLTRVIIKFVDKLKPRYFQGRSYRGVIMKTADLRAYRWAWKNKAAITTKTFCSTSADRRVAEMFTSSSPLSADQRNILMVFNFPEICKTAFDLRRLSHDLPCISEYEEEEEILLMQLSIFRVKSIKDDPNMIEIELENIPMK